MARLLSKLWRDWRPTLPLENAPPHLQEVGGGGHLSHRQREYLPEVDIRLKQVGFSTCVQVEAV